MCGLRGQVKNIPILEVFEVVSFVLISEWRYKHDDRTLLIGFEVALILGGAAVASALVLIRRAPHASLTQIGTCHPTTGCFLAAAVDTTLYARRSAKSLLHYWRRDSHPRNILRSGSVFSIKLHF